MWETFLERYNFYTSKGVVAAEARAQAGLDVLKRQATRTIIPRFAETFVREVWEMQSRLLQPKPQQIEALAGHARFRAGFDFLLLREKSGDTTTQAMGAWWDAYQNMTTDEKERAISSYNRQRAKSRRKANTQEAVIDPIQAEPKGSSVIEPLVKETESRSRRTRRTRNQDSREQKMTVVNQQGQVESISADHPILKRKRVQRDLSHVIFGPTQ